MDPNSSLLSPPSRACSHPAEPCTEGGRSPSLREQGRNSSFPWSRVPNSSLADPDWFWDEHIQAKRARVETIVQGMCLSPNPLMPGNARARGSLCCPEKSRERKRKQSLPMQQNPPKPGPAGSHGSRKGGPRVREQLHLLKQQLRHLQEHILQAAGPRDTAQGPGDPEKGRGPQGVKQRNGYGSRLWTVDSDHHQGPSRDLSGVEKHRVSEVVYQPEEPRFLPSGTRALLEILRKELTGAVSQAVDSVLQKVLLDPQGHLTQLGRTFQELVPEGRSETSPEGGACRDPPPLAALPRRAQAQAGVPRGTLSLAKPLDPPRYPVSPRMIPKPYQGTPANCAFTVSSHMQENQILSQLLGQAPNGHWSSSLLQDSSSQSHSSSEPALRPWGAVKLRPSVLNQQEHASPFSSTLLERLSLLPSVKMEQGDLQAVTDALPFSSVHIQEGLNPGHLKKAKLMFFFTRYPSSHLLKAYFPDVQFNRCITSQMIKWFSNFREFYYIQMEKFARQAISDGVTNPKMLVVLRNSELFRALNMHYNKGNDFEVPDCFLEIASLTLQEFFRAVSAGKDSDPSWKKPIYKIISKLDSDIPEIFKSSSYTQEQFQN
ncbi:prospero homeobox 2 [Rhinolophus ferrumequinum]|uniref:Prospero homeobox 2 n=1 Tax=Rhinolophus ferrumequinum TaxID=59479 RepID=A0A7J7XR12_RHIFE|nr:prospero homeobox protein 2 [Rhinolophus ferrumequinum]KAF6352161.1 prospero homeobox 2 [Rhinolophus ferrumequinum]